MALRRGHLECGANCWPDAVTSSQHIYEVRRRKDRRGIDLISDALPFGPPVVCRAKRSQQRNRLRKVLQPLTMML
jgi:hypothetical protein